MKQFILTSIVAAACAAAVAAQTPAAGQPDQEPTTTITGCLYSERDTPGRQPNEAERAGIGGDYILVSGAADGTAVGKTYEIDDLDDDKLRPLVGKRVELTGRYDDIDDDDDARETPAGTTGTTREDLPEFDARTVREVGGNCPATPSAGAPAVAMTGVAVSGSPAATQGATRPQSATATETETQTHTAPVTETPSHPATQPQPQPQPQAPPPPVTQAPTYPQTSPAPAATITLTGCLYRERDVPGRTPNIVERAGVLEDYILADASVQGAPASATGTAGATGTSGSSPAIGKMFKVEHVADEKLARFVGKRVEVTGKIDTEADEMKQAGTAGTPDTTTDRSAGPDRINLPEFEAASIREIAGTCPATPQK